MFTIGNVFLHVSHGFELHVNILMNVESIVLQKATHSVLRVLIHFSEGQSNGLD